MIKRNHIGKNGLSDVLHLTEVPSIGVLDISNNDIEDPDFLPEVLMKMPKLGVLYLQGNPVCKKIPNYRKTVIASIPTLKYLDDRPVFEEDRLFAEAFIRGGIEEERAERRRWQQAKEDAWRRNHEAFREMVGLARQ